jgi:hypothetical protein
MFLSLLGRPHSKLDVFRAFASRGVTEFPCSLRSVASVLGVELPHLSFHWGTQRRFGVARLPSGLAGPGFPTLLTYYAVHPRWQIECMHMAVLVHNSERELRLLDPLGRPPHRRNLHNVVIYLDVVRRDLKVEGTFYRINPHKAVSILQWGKNHAIGQ